MRKLIAANWKMYKTRAEAEATAHQLVSLLGTVPDGHEVILFAPFTAIEATRRGLGTTAHMHVGGQNLYPVAEGAFTGEISAAMLRDCGADWVLAGHSERRHIMDESDLLVSEKTAFALDSGLNVVLCIGETLEERESGRLEDVLRRQLDSGLKKVPSDLDPDRLAVAYEPVWAIGTGKVASGSDIVEAHAIVRGLLGSFLGSKAGHIAILYGGSVKPGNAASILNLDNVDGLLVGGASLQAESFAKIVRPE